jgi:hypothetical protein
MAGRLVELARAQKRRRYLEEGSEAVYRVVEEEARVQEGLELGEAIGGPAEMLMAVAMLGA